MNGPQQRPHDAIALGLAAIAKERVQFIVVRGEGHGRGEPLLNPFDGGLGVGLLIAACRRAEPGIEGVVTGQRRVSRIELAFPPLENQRGDGLGIVPPDFFGHGPKELEGRDHAFENRLGALEGQRQNERRVRVSPGRDQERYEPATIGEIDVDVTEVGFESFTGKMPQRDERFLMPWAVRSHIALHLGVPAAVALLVTETPEHLGSGMPLLGRGVFVIDKDLVDDRLKRSQKRSESIPGQGLGMGVRMRESMPNGLS